MGRRSEKWGFAVLLGLLAISAAVGCGSDGGEESASLTKAQYVKQADKICKETEKRQLKLIRTSPGKNFKPAPGSTPEEKLIEYAAIPTLNQQLDDLEALPAPEKDAATAKAFLQAFKEGIKETEEDPKSLLTSSTNPFVEAEELAVKFGFKTCGGP